MIFTSVYFRNDSSEDIVLNVNDKKIDQFGDPLVDEILARILLK